MSIKSYFRESMDKQHGKRVQALLKSASHHLYHIHRSLSSQLSWKMSLLQIYQILWLFLNGLAADEKFPVLNGDNITIPIQMQLLLNKCLKSPVLEDPSTGNMVNVPKHCSNLHHICQILWLLVNTLAAYQKFPVFNGDNLTIPCQMQIYQKHDFFFSQFLLHFWNLD